MSYLVTQMKEHLLAGCESIPAQNNPLATFTTQQSEELSLNCAIQLIKGSDETGLLSRVIYRFPSKVPASLEDVFRYVTALNQQLLHSQVFVVRDLDGDQGYYLRMDSVVRGTVERSQLATFLDDITTDVSILLTYFNHQAPQQASKISTVTQPYTAEELHWKCG